MFYLKGTFVTVHDHPWAEIDALWTAVHRNPAAELGKGAQVLYHSVVDRAVDAYFPVLDQIDERVEALEMQVFEAGGRNDVLPTLFRLRRSVRQLLRAARNQRESVQRLAVGTVRTLTKETCYQFRDVHDHLLLLHDNLDDHRETLGGLRDTYLGVISNRMNEVMKALTVFSAILLPLTFLSGLFGMNVRVPWQDDIVGFWIIVAVCVACTPDLAPHHEQAGLAAPHHVSAAAGGHAPGPAGRRAPRRPPRAPGRPRLRRPGRGGRGPARRDGGGPSARPRVVGGHGCRGAALPAPDAHAGRALARRRGRPPRAAPRRPRTHPGRPVRLAARRPVRADAGAGRRGPRDADARALRDRRRRDVARRLGRVGDDPARGRDDAGGARARGAGAAGPRGPRRARRPAGRAPAAACSSRRRPPTRPWTPCARPARARPARRPSTARASRPGRPGSAPSSTTASCPTRRGSTASISWTKGCYVGQEPVVMARHRGHPATLLVGLSIEAGPVPAPEAALLLDAKPVGRVTTVARASGGPGRGRARVRAARARARGGDVRARGLRRPRHRHRRPRALSRSPDRRSPVPPNRREFGACLAAQARGRSPPPRSRDPRNLRRPPVRQAARTKTPRGGVPRGRRRDPARAGRPRVGRPGRRTTAGCAAPCAAAPPGGRRACSRA